MLKKPLAKILMSKATPLEAQLLSEKVNISPYIYSHHYWYGFYPNFYDFSQKLDYLTNFKERNNYNFELKIQ
jgi:hypothetical protein